MEMYIGTYSDDAIVSFIKQRARMDKATANDSPHNTNYYARLLNAMEGANEDGIITNIIERVRADISFAHFFAKDLNEAKNTALQLDLKNFSSISNIVYKKGNDY